MRSITRLILHCSASLAGIDLTGRDILRMHTNPVSQGGRGWHNPGYHYVVRLDGTIDQILPESRIANGVKGYNADSIHICYVGGLLKKDKGEGKSEKSLPAKLEPANTMTSQQRSSIVHLLHDLRIRYPTATLHGHNEFAAKACPCFDVRSEFPEFA